MRSPLGRWMILPLLAVPVSSWAFGLGEVELQSGFGQPLRAQIELLSATPEILETLHVDLAPVASFEQFAVDRPAFLRSFKFTIARDDAGRSVVLVTSTQPISELFVTMLVQASWSGGISLREYTMLVDLPVQAAYTAPAPGQSAQALPPESNVVDGETRQATTSAPQPSTPVVSSEARTATPAQAMMAPDSSDNLPTHGPVKRAETLWDIAAQYRPAGVTMNQAMVAIYEANPQAFGNNMNVLRIGAVLRIPDLVALRGVTANTATVEVQRQTAEWQDRSPEQVRLSAPSPSPGLSTGEDTQASAQVTQAQSTVDDTQISALQDQIGVLQSDLEEIRRVLAIRDQELSDLRAQVAAGGDREAATPPELETAIPPPAGAVADADLQSIPLFPDEPAIEEPAEAEALTPPPAATVPAASAQGLATVPEERSAASQSRMVLIVSIAVGVGALLLTALWFWRRPSSAAIADGAGSREALEGDIDTGDTGVIAAPFAKAPNDDFVVHEQQVKKTVRDQHGELLLVEEDADALAEADFHMAWGSYGQAAARISKALEEAPDNRELKLRLMEIFFQWGNKEGFLEAARELRADLGEQTDSVWDKAVIMGRQLCPDERLFAEATPSAGEIDLHLQAKDSSTLDLEFDEQVETDVDVDTGSVDDAGVEPDTIDDAATVRSEPVDGTTARSEAIGDREQTAALPATPAEADVSTQVSLDGGELPRAEESPTVTQERRELEASDSLDEEAAASSTTHVSETVDEEAAASSTTFASETPESAVTEESDDNTASETLLPAEDMAERGADDEEQELALVDDLVTRLDLARAYISIGQPELAIPMLQEALQEAEGEPEQVRRTLEEALQEAEAGIEKTKRSA